MLSTGLHFASNLPVGAMIDQLRFAWSPPEWVVSDLMLPNCRSLPSPHGISKRTMCRPTRLQFRGRLIRLGEMSEDDAQSLHRGSGGAHTQGKRAQHGKPQSVVGQR